MPMKKEYNNGMDKRPRGPIGVKREGKGYKKTWKSKAGNPNERPSGQEPFKVREYRSVTVRKIREYLRRWNDTHPRKDEIKRISYMTKKELIAKYKEKGGKINVYKKQKPDKEKPKKKRGRPKKILGRRKDETSEEYAVRLKKFNKEKEERERKKKEKKEKKAGRKPPESKKPHKYDTPQETKEKLKELMEKKKDKFPFKFVDDFNLTMWKHIKKLATMKKGKSKYINTIKEKAKEAVDLWKQILEMDVADTEKDITEESFQLYRFKPLFMVSGKKYLGVNMKYLKLYIEGKDLLGKKVSDKKLKQIYGIMPMADLIQIIIGNINNIMGFDTDGEDPDF
tara:strand:- start:3374 stop:4390 length:1017 start_codon:yes stop_codon:yes gene_type:complete